MKTTALVLAAVTALSSPALAQPTPRTTPPPPPPKSTGPVSSTPFARVHIHGQVFIGERAPDFALDASSGKLIRLSGYRGEWVVLVFADRKERFTPLVEIHDELRPLGVRILGVCKEKARSVQSFAGRGKLPFVLGADFSGEISSLYGVYDGERSTIVPGFMLIDREGVVRMALIGQQLPPDQLAALVRYAVTGL